MVFVSLSCQLLFPSFHFLSLVGHSVLLLFFSSPPGRITPPPSASLHIVFNHFFLALSFFLQNPSPSETFLLSISLSVITNAGTSFIFLLLSRAFLYNLFLAYCFPSSLDLIHETLGS
ncbi:hypothetical protein QBC43DRAFT_62252 [Cladorrhinum sp. PSN259]|nr:hypothetical protein QBC43DRAFT_62252 [Cladorrhinum sp. PSN259]